MAELSCLEQKSGSEQSSKCVSPDTLKILTDNSRYIFTGIFTVITVASIVGNTLAIYSITKSLINSYHNKYVNDFRKYKCVQKTSIISLALSDIFSTVVIAINNIETFSHELLIWTLGEFLCSFIPMCQMAGVLASSVALMFIAMDRYRSVVHALSKKWNPSLKICVTGATILCILSFAISYPMFVFFNQEDITIIYYMNTSQGIQFETENAKVCISFEKDSMRIYYIAMVIIIFLPLLIVFVWFYYNIALLVWKHRKPSTAVSNKRENSGLENSVSNTKSTETPVPKKRDIKVERKIRTFKIIITLMIVFIFCRLPYFAVFLLKLSLELDALWFWILNYTFIALHIVNCCLNPLLYTYLNQTFRFWMKMKKLIKYITWEVCCFCFSKSDFEEFERDNPFFVENHEQIRNCIKVKFQPNVQQIDTKY